MRKKKIADISHIYLQTNTYQAVLFTNGLHTGIIMLYQEDSMNWNPLSKGISARIGYNTKTSRLNVFPSDYYYSTRIRSYRPNEEIGSTGLKGQYLYQLDNNPTHYTNPRSYCLNWYYQDSGAGGFTRWWWWWWFPRFDNPCPCSYWQARDDPAFTRCNVAPYIPSAYSTSSYIYTYPNCTLIKTDRSYCKT